MKVLVSQEVKEVLDFWYNNRKDKEYASVSLIKNHDIAINEGYLWGGELECLNNVSMNMMNQIANHGYYCEDYLPQIKGAVEMIYDAYLNTNKNNVSIDEYYDSLGFARGIKYMNETFNLGLKLEDK